MSDVNHLSEVDHLRLQLRNERYARLRVQATMAAQSAQEAQGQLAQLEDELRATYDLQAGDACDTDTGAITRAPRPPPVEPPAESKPVEAPRA